MILIEIAVESHAAARAAAEGGADRIELCADLSGAGGLTPDETLTNAVLSDVGIPIYAMIRPRAGDFIYSASEISDMCRTIERFHTLGMHGVVAGALTTAHEIDVNATASLLSAAGGLPFTFHRAFDRVADQAAALATLMELGVTRVLTSAGAATAFEGIDRLRALVQQSAGRIAILPGGGIRASNVAAVIAGTGVREVHSKLLDEKVPVLTIAAVRQFRAAVDAL